MSKQVTVIVEGREYVVEVGNLNERPIRATVNQKTYEVNVPAQQADTSSSKMPAASVPSVSAHKKTSVVPAQSGSGFTITAPMPGDIVAVNVKPGNEVSPGDVVCVLEAMKMKNMIRTPQAGVIAAVAVNAGESVDFGAVLITFE